LIGKKTPITGKGAAKKKKSRFGRDREANVGVVGKGIGKVSGWKRTGGGLGVGEGKEGD